MSLHCFFFFFPLWPHWERKLHSWKNTHRCSLSSVGRLMEPKHINKSSLLKAHKQTDYRYNESNLGLHSKIWTLIQMLSAWSKHKRRLTAAADVCILCRVQSAAIFSWLKQFNNHKKIHTHDIHICNVLCKSLVLQAKWVQWFYKIQMKIQSYILYFHVYLHISINNNSNELGSFLSFL